MERTYKINNSDITVKFGNILDSEAEVMASSDGSTIRMGGGGVAQAIRNAGGDVIRDDAQSKLPVNLGDAVITTAGHLKHQKYIFHCITIDRSIDHTNTPQGVSNASPWSGKRKSSPSVWTCLPIRKVSSMTSSTTTMWFLTTITGWLVTTNC